MTLQCPHCNQEILSKEIRLEFGLDPGNKCPKCGGNVRPYRPHKWLVAVVSALLAGLVIRLLDLKSLPVAIIGAAALWVVLALMLNVLLQGGRPLKLEAVVSRRSPSDPFRRLLK